MPPESTRRHESQLVWASKSSLQAVSGIPKRPGSRGGTPSNWPSFAKIARYKQPYANSRPRIRRDDGVARGDVARRDADERRRDVARRHAPRERPKRCVGVAVARGAVVVGWSLLFGCSFFVMF